jgi:ketosteroid isomerase-like protein
MKRSLFVCLLVVTGLSYNATAQSADKKSIRQVLNEQIKSWNNNDLESFMTGYWNDDSVLFIGKSGPKYGYQTTLDNYKKGYPTKEAMGTLTFDILQMKRLSVLYYFVVGKFHLERTIGNAEGYFTLLFRKVKGKWVIVADHSS